MRHGARAARRAFERLTLVRHVQRVTSMTTIGQLIEALYAKYERELHDHELAAVATQRALERILRRRR